MNGNRLVTRCILAVGLFPFFVSAMHAAPPSSEGAKQYVCRSCPVPCHDQLFDKPGACPQCGMTLVEYTVRNVAILIWDGVELLDFAGPGEVFDAAQVGGKNAFHVYTVAPTAETITCQGFVKITPNYSIENCPMPNVLIIPGGGARPLLQNTELMDWVRETSNDTEMIMSVCTGAFVLAHAGLLDDLEATTWYGAVENLRKDAPKTKVHADRRFVDNGDIITTAGVSAGIDGALHAVSRLTGPDIARKTAKYMEYDWRPNPLPSERKAMLKRRIRNDAGGVIDELEVALRDGTRDVSEILPDPTYIKLHENPRFRDVIKQNAYGASATLTPPDEPGEPMIVSGTIRDTAGKPVRGADIYVYHTNKAGVYSSKGGNTGSMGDSLNPRLFGYLTTGMDGRYEYRTIQPGQYPDNGPPAHVHYEVSARGYKEKVTELMWEDDSRLTSTNRSSFERDGFIITRLTNGNDGVLRGVCDVTIEKLPPATKP